MFCDKCGRNIGDNGKCPYCSAETDGSSAEYSYSFAEYYAKKKEREAQDVKKTPGEYSDKSVVTAGLLQLFTGGLGLGRFYLGYNVLGAFQLAASLMSCGVIGFIWGFADGVLILSGNVKYDGEGKPLRLE